MYLEEFRVPKVHVSFSHVLHHKDCGERDLPFSGIVKKKVKQPRYSPGVAQRVPGS